MAAREGPPYMALGPAMNLGVSIGGSAPMTSANDESRLIRQVYAGALQRDPEERDEYLDRACADQPELRRKVVALLEAHSQDFLDAPVIAGAAPVGDHTQDRVEGGVIGPYIIRRELGRGGMGVVYLADDTRLSRRVALKALSPGLGHQLGGKERLRLEARAAAGLSHPGIATVYALEEIGNDLYLSCEFVPGEPLRALLKSGPLPIDQVVDIGTQLAKALAAAHTQGIVHRDIKPENVMRTPSGVVKVLDFGLARVESSAHSRLTHTGVILGTPAYLAPEQALGQKADFRTDLFALGLLIYELASGLNPFAARSITATIARIVEEEAAPLSDVQPHSVPDLDRIVAICLRKNPLERYSSTQEVVVDLERLQAALSEHRRPAPLRSAGSSAAAKDQRVAARRWWEVHQLVVSVLYALMLYPAWYIRAWLSPPWGILFLLAVLATAAAAISLRLHVWFVARFFPHELSVQQSWTRLRTRWCDAGLGVLQIGAALVIAGSHPEFAMLFVAVSAATLIASFVIEPATARVVFGGAPGAAG